MQVDVDGSRGINVAWAKTQIVERHSLVALLRKSDEEPQEECTLSAFKAAQASIILNTSRNHTRSPVISRQALAKHVIIALTLVRMQMVGETSPADFPVNLN